MFFRHIALTLCISIGLIEPTLADSTRTVYRCQVQGQWVFSDQPCGVDAEQQTIPDSNRMVAPSLPAASSTPSTTRSMRSKDTQDISDDREQRRARCQHIREQLADILSQQRMGYTAKQGEQLRVRRVKLDEQYRQQRCERYR